MTTLLSKYLMLRNSNLSSEFLILNGHLNLVKVCCYEMAIFMMTWSFLMRIYSCGMVIFTVWVCEFMIGPLWFSEVLLSWNVHFFWVSVYFFGNDYFFIVSVTFYEMPLFYWVSSKFLWGRLVDYRFLKSKHTSRQVRI